MRKNGIYNAAVEIGELIKDQRLDFQSAIEIISKKCHRSFSDKDKMKILEIMSGLDYEASSKDLFNFPTRLSMMRESAGWEKRHTGCS